MSTQHHNSVREHRNAVDRACERYHLGGVTVWRTVKAASVLLTVVFAFYAHTGGKLSAQFALIAMITVILGAEGIETLLAAIGSEGVGVTIKANADDDNGE